MQQDMLLYLSCHIHEFQVVWPTFAAHRRSLQSYSPVSVWHCNRRLHEFSFLHDKYWNTEKREKEKRREGESVYVRLLERDIMLREL